MPVVTRNGSGARLTASSAVGLRNKGSTVRTTHRTPPALVVPAPGPNAYVYDTASAIAATLGTAGVHGKVRGVQSEGSLRTGLVSYYAFNENTGAAVGDGADSNGGSWQGTLGSQWSAPGKLGTSAGSFNGTDNSVLLGNPTNLQIAGSLSIAAWIYLTASGVCQIVTKANDAASAYNLDTFLGKARFYINGGTGANFLIGNTTMATLGWNHVVGVYDAAALTMDLYVNGVSDATTLLGVDTAISGSSANVQIGRQELTDPRWFPGRIDEVGIWSRALSASEVSALYSSTIGLDRPLLLATASTTRSYGAVKSLSNAGFGHSAALARVTGFARSLATSIASTTVVTRAQVLARALSLSIAHVAALVDIHGYPRALLSILFSNSLTGYWSLDENGGSTALSALGSTSNGTWHGTLGNQWTTGILAGGGLFNGTDNFVQITSGALTFPQVPMSVSAWVYMTATPTGDGAVIFMVGVQAPGSSRSGLASDAQPVALYVMPDGTVIYQTRSSANFATWYQSSATISLNTWHHIVGTSNTTVHGPWPNTLAIYIDGVADTSAAYIRNGSVNTAHEPRIGAEAYASPHGGYFTGTIDEVGFWMRELTATEVTFLYNGGAGRVAMQRTLTRNMSITKPLAPLAPLGAWKTLFSDTFVRADASGTTWGTASDGSTWTDLTPTTPHPTVNITSNRGGEVTTTKQSLQVIGSVPTATPNIDILVRVSGATGSSLDLYGRCSSSASAYILFLSINGSLSFLQPGRLVSGAQTNFSASPFVTLAANTLYWCRFRIAGYTLSARLWADGASEPTTWNVTTTDTTQAYPGTGTDVQVGIAMNSATADDITVDSYSVTSLLPLTGMLARIANAPRSLSLSSAFSASVVANRALVRAMSLTMTYSAAVTRGGSIIALVSTIAHAVSLDRIYGSLSAATATVTSSVSIAIAQVLARSMTPTTSHAASSDRALTLTRPQSSAISPMEALVRITGFVLSLATTLSDTAAVDRALVIARSVSVTVPPVALGDRMYGGIRSVTSLVGRGATLTRLLALGRTMANALSSLASPDRLAGKLRALATTGAQTSDLARATTVARSVSITLSSFVATDRVYGALRSVVTTLSPTTLLARGLLLARSLAHVLVPATILDRAGNLGRSLADTRTLTADATGNQVVTRSTSATTAITALTDRAQILGRSVVNVVGAAFDLTRVYTALRIASEDIAHTPVLSTASSVARAATIVISPLASVDRIYGAFRSTIVAISPASLVGRGLVLLRALAHTLASTSALDRLASVGRTLTDFRTPASGVTGILVVLRPLSIAIDLTALADRAQTLGRALASTLSATAIVDRVYGAIDTLTSTIAQTSQIAYHQVVLRELSGLGTPTSTLMRVYATIRVLSASDMLTGSLTRTVSLARDLTQTLGHTVSSLRIVGIVRSLATTQTPTALVDLALTLTRTVTTSIAPATMTATLYSALRTLVSTADHGATGVRSLALSRALAVLTSITARLDQTYTAFRSLQETQAPSALATRSVVLTRLVTITVTCTDALTAFSSVLRTLASAGTMSVAIDRAVTLTRSMATFIAHTTGFADAYLRTLSIALDLSALLDRSQAGARSFSAATASTASLSSLYGAVAQIVTTLSPASTLERGATLGRSLTATHVPGAILDRAATTARSLAATMPHTILVAFQQTLTRALSYAAGQMDLVTTASVFMRQSTATGSHLAALARRTVVGRFLIVTSLAQAALDRLLAAVRTPSEGTSPASMLADQVSFIRLVAIAGTLQSALDRLHATTRSLSTSVPSLVSAVRAVIQVRSVTTTTAHTALLASVRYLHRLVSASGTHDTTVDRRVDSTRLLMVAILSLSILNTASGTTVLLLSTVTQSAGVAVRRAFLRLAAQTIVKVAHVVRRTDATRESTATQDSATTLERQGAWGRLADTSVTLDDALRRQSGLPRLVTFSASSTASVERQTILGRAVLTLVAHVPALGRSLTTAQTLAARIPHSISILRHGFITRAQSSLVPASAALATLRTFRRILTTRISLRLRLRTMRNGAVRAAFGAATRIMSYTPALRVLSFVGAERTSLLTTSVRSRLFAPALRLVRFLASGTFRTGGEDMLSVPIGDGVAYIGADEINQPFFQDFRSRLAPGEYLTTVTVTARMRLPGATSYADAPNGFVGSVQLAGSVTRFTGVVGTGFTTPPTIVIAPPPYPGAAATASPVLTGTALTDLALIDGGLAYPTPPLVSIVGGGGSGGAATAVVPMTGVLYQLGDVDAPAVVGATYYVGLVATISSGRIEAVAVPGIPCPG